MYYCVHIILVYLKRDKRNYVASSSAEIKLASMSEQNFSFVSQIVTVDTFSTFRLGLYFSFVMND